MVEKLDTSESRSDRIERYVEYFLIFFSVATVIVSVVMLVWLYAVGLIYGDKYKAAEEESARAYAYEINEPYRQAAQVAIAELNQELADDMSPVMILNTVVDFYCRAPYDAKVFDDEKLIRTYATQQWETNWRSDIIDLPYSFDAAVSERCG